MSKSDEKENLEKKLLESDLDMAKLMEMLKNLKKGKPTPNANKDTFEKLIPQTIVSNKSHKFIVVKKPDNTP
jgi:hypothetical protein